MNDDAARLVEAMRHAQRRCSELAKIEIIRPRPATFAVQRLDVRT